MRTITRPARIIVQIRLDEDQVERVDALAEEDGRTRSDMIRRLVFEALYQRGEAAKQHSARNRARGDSEATTS